MTIGSIKNYKKISNTQRKQKINGKQEESKTYGLAIATLITGILTILGLIDVLLEMLFILLTLIFGVISLIEIKKRKNLSGTGYVIAGFVFMVIFFIISSVATYSVEHCNKSFVEESYLDCDKTCTVSCASKGYSFGKSKAETVYTSSDGKNMCKCLCEGCPS